MTTTNSSGIVFLEETDPISPFHTLINLLQTGTSNALNNLGTTATSTVAPITLIPSGSSDATTGTWVTFGNVNKPSWSSRAVITLALNGIYLVSALGTNVSLRVRLGSAAGVYSRITDPGAIGQRFTYAASFELTGLTGSGAQSLYLETNRAAGTGAYRADTSCTLSAVVTWQS